MTSKITTGLMAQGSYEIDFRRLPDLIDEFVPGRHLMFYRGAELYFAGVILEPLRDAFKITAKGPGPEWWLGEDDKKGNIREPRTYDNLRTDQIVDNLLFREDGTRALLPGTLNQGNVVPFSIAWESSRYSIQRLAVMTRTEYRVNPNFTLDWAGNLAFPGLFVNHDGVAGAALVLSAAAGTVQEQVEYEPSAFSVFDKVYALGHGEGDAMIVKTATAVLPAAWKDHANQAFRRGLVVDAPNAGSDTEAQFVATAQAALHATERLSATARLARADLLGDFRDGDTVYVHEPLIIEDPVASILYEGRTYPAVGMRVVRTEIDLGPEWRVALRLPDGSEVDLTDCVELAAETVATVHLADDPDRFYEVGIAPGTTLTDTRRDPGPSDPNADETTPAAPAGLNVTVTTYKDYAGSQRARLRFAWTAVTQNTDGSQIIDLQEYVVRYRRVEPGSTAWETEVVGAPATELSIEDLPVGITWEAQVAAVDQNNNQSAWAPASPVNTDSDADTTPPPQPQAPTEVVGGVTQVHVRWDAVDAGGQPMPPDIRWWEVHASQTGAGFTPTAATLQGEVYGTLFSFDAAEGDWWVKLIAVDRAGNKSAASGATGPADVILPGDLEIPPGYINATHIADGAVQTAKLADGAVKQEKIAVGTIAADRLVVGDFTNLVEDPSFEKASPRWGTRSNLFTLVTDPTNARSGAKCGRLQGSGSGEAYVHLPIGSVGATVDGRVDCRAGDELYFEGWAKGSTTNGQVAIFVRFLDAAGTQIALGNAAQRSLTTGYGLMQGRIVAPAGSVYAEAYVSGFINTNGTIYLDDFYARRVIVTAFIADAAIVTAKIADLAVGTAKIDNLAVTAAKIQDLAVGTAKIADLAVTNAKIGSMVVDKITSGSLSATVTISGLIRTGTSGDRVELDSNGMRIYDTGGVNLLFDVNTNIGLMFLRSAATGSRAEFLNGSAMDLYAQEGHSGGALDIGWWRLNQGDASEYLRIGGNWHANGVVGYLTVHQKSAFAVGSLLIYTQDSGGGIEQYIHLDQGNNRLILDGDLNGGNKGSIELYKAGSSEQVRVQGLARFVGAGMIIENGNAAGFNVAGNTKSGQTNVSYASSFPSGTPMGLMLGLKQSNYGVGMAMYGPDSTTGATIWVHNFSGSTLLFEVHYVPFGL